LISFQSLSATQKIIYPEIDKLSKNDLISWLEEKPLDNRKKIYALKKLRDKISIKDSERLEKLLNSKNSDLTVHRYIYLYQFFKHLKSVNDLEKILLESTNENKVNAALWVLIRIPSKKIADKLEKDSRTIIKPEYKNRYLSSFGSELAFQKATYKEKVRMLLTVVLRGSEYNQYFDVLKQEDLIVSPKEYWIVRQFEQLCADKPRELASCLMSFKHLADIIFSEKDKMEEEGKRAYENYKTKNTTKRMLRMKCHLVYFLPEKCKEQLIILKLINENSKPIFE